MNYSLGSSFLTEKTTHTRFLALLSASSKLLERNTVALKHLTSEVPFVREIELKDLCKVRERERDTVLQYRAALRQAAETFRDDESISSQERARSLYFDVIAPRLASLEQRVTEAKRDLVKKVYRPLVGWAGAISLGLYNGLIPEQLAGAASAIGLAQAASGIIQGAMSLRDAEREIKADDFYFLWKVKQATKK